MRMSQQDLSKSNIGSQAEGNPAPGSNCDCFRPVSASCHQNSILVVDDNPVVREGIVRLISQQSDMLCCGQAGTAAAAQTSVERLKPDLVILDLRLKSADGLELLKSLKSQSAGLRVLILSQYDAPMYVERALRAGAQGYVVKEQGADELIQAIRTVLAGDVYLSRGMAS